MKLVIDEKECIKHKLTQEEVLIALAIRSSKDFNTTLSNLLSREVLVQKNSKYLITQRWDEEIDELLLDSSSAIDDEERLQNLAVKMRDCFPAGMMPGTPFYYKCNRREIMLAMKKFFRLHGDYPDDEIIDACKRFVASYRGDYKYLPIIKHFITKSKTMTDDEGCPYIVEESKLADFLENKEEQDILQADDWRVTMRN